LSRLPVVSGRELTRVLYKIGYELDRQRGSHMIFRQAASPHRRIVVPNHDPIAKGTLRAIIKEAGLTVEELIGLL
jgi:predicted RNA binding protein YcfA (HicA-like mRNA interferase family)